MRLRRPSVRPVLVGVLALALLGCAEDDPLEFGVTVQATTTTTVAVASDTPVVDDDDTIELVEEAVFPPVNPKISRPRTIVDLRGNAIVNIEIRDNVFDERDFRVDPDTQIVFTNVGANTHDVSAGAEGAFPKITKEALEEGPQALVLSVEGDYPYFCSIHGTAQNGQTGYIVVGGA